MKILISEAQYELLVMELQHHPEDHDIDQRKLRMSRLESGVKVIMDWTPRELMRVSKQFTVPVTKGDPQTEIIGKYIMTPGVSKQINERLDDTYTYTFPKFKSFAILIYDFVLTSNDVLNEKIMYNGQPEDNTMKEKVKSIMKKKDLMSATLSLTGYEEIDKSKPGSELSDKYRANYMVMIVDRNVAKTVFLTSKKQWEDKTFYGDFGWSIDEYIRYDQIPNHATRIEPRKPITKEPEKIDVEKTDKNSEVKETPVYVSEDVNKTWLMEWINSAK